MSNALPKLAVLTGAKFVLMALFDVTTGIEPLDNLVDLVPLGVVV